MAAGAGQRIGDPGSAAVDLVRVVNGDARFGSADAHRDADSCRRSYVHSCGSTKGSSLFTDRSRRVGCVWTLRYVTIVEQSFPVAFTRCLHAKLDCPRECKLMGGSQFPFVRDISGLDVIGFRPGPALAKLQSALMQAVSKPLTYRIIDKSLQSFNGGFREYADRFVIWFDPLVKSEYALAHEYAHGIMHADESSYIDPRLTSASDATDRHTVSLAASVVDHPLVHATLDKFGFDTTQECEERTREAIDSLTPAAARNIAAARAKGGRGAFELALMNAEILTTYRSRSTVELEDRLQGAMPREILEETAAIVAVVRRRTAGQLGATEAAKETLSILGLERLGKFFVDRGTFEANLVAWSA